LSSQLSTWAARFEGLPEKMRVTATVRIGEYGEREPIADNTTETGRAENRRVVLRILAP
jgi:outer membrane protein OmpA-like peptidoglycan-associated protein